MSRKRYHAAFALLAAAVVARWVWRPFRVVVEGASMVPTLEPGDLLVATARGRLEPGRLVVVEHPSREGYELVKRLAPTPGRTPPELVLADGELWILGDNPGASTDSRSLGPVRRRAIRGVVRLRYWPPSRWGRVG